MLDNMKPETMKEAVSYINGKLLPRHRVILQQIIWLLWQKQVWI